MARDYRQAMDFETYKQLYFLKDNSYDTTGTAHYINTIDSIQTNDQATLSIKLYNVLKEQFKQKYQNSIKNKDMQSGLTTNMCDQVFSSLMNRLNVKEGKDLTLDTYYRTLSFINSENFNQELTRIQFTSVQINALQQGIGDLQNIINRSMSPIARYISTYPVPENIGNAIPQLTALAYDTTNSDLNSFSLEQIRQYIEENNQDALLLYKYQNKYSTERDRIYENLTDKQKNLFLIIANNLNDNNQALPPDAELKLLNCIRSCNSDKIPNDINQDYYQMLMAVWRYSACDDTAKVSDMNNANPLEVASVLYAQDSKVFDDNMKSSVQIIRPTNSKFIGSYLSNLYKNLQIINGYDRENQEIYKQYEKNNSYACSLYSMLPKRTEDNFESDMVFLNSVFYIDNYLEVSEKRYRCDAFLLNAIGDDEGKKQTLSDLCQDDSKRVNFFTRFYSLMSQDLLDSEAEESWIFIDSIIQQVKEDKQNQKFQQIDDFKRGLKTINEYSLMPPVSELYSQQHKRYEQLITEAIIPAESLNRGYNLNSLREDMMTELLSDQDNSNSDNTNSEWLNSSSSDESQDMPHTQHYVPNYDNTQYNRFEFDNYPFNTLPPQFDNWPPIPNTPLYYQGSQNMPPYHQGPQNMFPYGYSQNLVGHDLSNGSPSSFIHNTSNREEYDTGDLHSNASGAGFESVSSDDEYKRVRELLETQSKSYTIFRPMVSRGINDMLLKKDKDIKFEEIIQYYEEYKIFLEQNDVKILQTLYGLEQGANFSVDSNGNTYMTKKNDSGEDIYVCTTPVSYNDERFEQILQNFLETHQNFSGIFAVTCNYDLGDEWSLTTCKIQNGQITNVCTPMFFAADRRSLGAMYCLKYLLSKNSYDEYKEERALQEEYFNKALPIINTVNQSIKERRRMQDTPEFNQPQFNMPPPPQFGNFPPIPNIPSYNPGPQNMPLHNGDQRNTSRYAAYSTNHTKRDSSNDRPVLYYIYGTRDKESCRRTLQKSRIGEIAGTSGDGQPVVLRGLVSESLKTHMVVDRNRQGKPEYTFFNSIWKEEGEYNKLKEVTYDQVINQLANHYSNTAERGKEGYWLNSGDIDLLKLYYAQKSQSKTGYQVLYHYNPVDENLKTFGKLQQYQTIVTEIKTDQNVSYFMMPCMTVREFQAQDDSFVDMENMVKSLQADTVQDGVYLIPTCQSSTHWELTCAKKQGDSLEYFVTSIPSNSANCGLNTVKAMQDVIENGYEAAKDKYAHRFDTRVDFAKKDGVVKDKEQTNDISDGEEDNIGNEHILIEENNHGVHIETIPNDIHRNGVGDRYNSNSGYRYGPQNSYTPFSHNFPNNNGFNNPPNVFTPQNVPIVYKNIEQAMQELLQQGVIANYEMCFKDQTFTCYCCDQKNHIFGLECGCYTDVARTEYRFVARGQNIPVNNDGYYYSLYDEQGAYATSSYKMRQKKDVQYFVKEFSQYIDQYRSPEEERRREEERRKEEERRREAENARLYNMRSQRFRQIFKEYHFSKNDSGNAIFANTYFESEYQNQCYINCSGNFRNEKTILDNMQNRICDGNYQPQIYYQYSRNKLFIHDINLNADVNQELQNINLFLGKANICERIKKIKELAEGANLEIKYKADGQKDFKTFNIDKDYQDFFKNNAFKYTFKVGQKEYNFDLSTFRGQREFFANIDEDIHNLKNFNELNLEENNDINHKRVYLKGHNKTYLVYCHTNHYITDVKQLSINSVFNDEKCYFYESRTKKKTRPIKLLDYIDEGLEGIVSSIEENRNEQPRQQPERLIREHEEKRDNTILLAQKINEDPILCHLRGTCAGGILTIHSDNPSYEIQLKNDSRSDYTVKDRQITLGEFIQNSSDTDKIKLVVGYQKLNNQPYYLPNKTYLNFVNTDNIRKNIKILMLTSFLSNIYTQHRKVIKISDPSNESEYVFSPTDDNSYLESVKGLVSFLKDNRDNIQIDIDGQNFSYNFSTESIDDAKNGVDKILLAGAIKEKFQNHRIEIKSDTDGSAYFKYKHDKFKFYDDRGNAILYDNLCKDGQVSYTKIAELKHAYIKGDNDLEEKFYIQDFSDERQVEYFDDFLNKKEQQCASLYQKLQRNCQSILLNDMIEGTLVYKTNGNDEYRILGQNDLYTLKDAEIYYHVTDGENLDTYIPAALDVHMVNGRQESLKYNNNHMQEYADSLQRRHLILDQMPRPENIEERKRDNIDYLTNYIFRNMLLSNDCKTLVNTKNEFAGQHKIQLFDNNGHEIIFNNVEPYNEESIKDKLQRTKTIKFSYKNGKYTSYDGFNEFDMERDDYTTFQARMKTMEQADALYIIADDTGNNLGEQLFDSTRRIGEFHVFSEDEYKGRGTQQNAEDGLRDYRRIAVEKILGNAGLISGISTRGYLYLNERQYRKSYYVKFNHGYVQGNEGLVYDGVREIGLWLRGEEDYLTQRVNGPIEGAQLCCNLIKRHIFANEVEQRRLFERKKRFKVDEHTYENGDYQGFRKALIDHSVEDETTEERKKVTLIRPNDTTVPASPKFNIFNNPINEVLAVIDGQIGSAVNPKLVDTFNELGYHFQFENATKTAFVDCNGTQIYVGKKNSRGRIDNLASNREVNNIKDFLELCDKDPQNNKEILLYCDINGQRICSKGIQYKDYKEVEESTKEELKGFHERIAIIKKLQEIGDQSDITISFTKAGRLIRPGEYKTLTDCLGDLQKFSDDIALCDGMTIKCGDNTVIYNLTKECRDHYDFYNLDDFINRMNKNVNNDAKDDLQSDLQWDTGEHTYKYKDQRCEVYYRKNDRNFENVEDGKTADDIIKGTRKYEQEEPLRIKYKDVNCLYYLYSRDAKERNERIYSMVDFCDDFIKLNRDEGITYEIKNAVTNSIIRFDDNVVRMCNRLKGKKCKIKMTKDGDSEEIEVSFDTKDHIVEAITKLRDTADDLLNPIGLDMLNTFDSPKKKKHKKRKKTKDESVDIEDTTVIKDEEIKESKKEKKKKEKDYNPFEDIENNSELRKLVESFIEQSDPDMSAVIKNNSLMSLFDSGTIIDNFRKAAKPNKDYLAGSSNATDTMNHIQNLDSILKSEGGFYDKCEYYQDLNVKLTDVNVHELQLLAIQEYLRANDTKSVKYFTSDKSNGPNYVYIEDKKLLISLSPEGYGDDFVGQNKELEELIKSNSVTKLSAKQKDGDWVLDCYLDKDKEHLIVDSKVDGRQVGDDVGGVWSARATNEIIALGLENFQFLNAYRQTIHECPEFLKGETSSDLDKIKLSFRKFNHLEKEKQTAETFTEILDEVENKSPVEVIQELKYTVMDKNNTAKSKKDKEKEKEEEAKRKAEHNLEIDENIKQITKKENRNKFFGFSFSGSAVLAIGIGGPLGIVAGLAVCAASIIAREMILRRKNKSKLIQDTQDKKVEDIKNKPLLEAQPSLGNEAHNDNEKSEKNTTKLLAEDLSKLSTKDLDLNANNILVDNVKVKKKEQVRESS